MGQLFVDERGQALRVTWHAEADVVVLSIWRRDECVGTVRLHPPEARRLAKLLDEVNGVPEAPQAQGHAAPGETEDPRIDGE